MIKKPCYIIAEIGVNHNGCLNTAKSLIKVAADAGCNAVKFQTFKAETLLNKDAPLADYQANNDIRFTSQYEMIKSLELKHEDHYLLRDFAHNLNIDFISTPFDYDSLFFLVDKLKLEAIKFSSGDLSNSPLLLEAGKIANKIIISTGMSSLRDIELALCSIAYGYLFKKNPDSSNEMFESVYLHDGLSALKNKVIILHCVSQYPAPYEAINLKAIQTIKKAFKIPVGYSDHTLGIEIAVAAVTLGAQVIEKHITLDKNSAGPDHQASIEPKELVEMVAAIRNVEKALQGDGLKKPSIVEKDVMLAARKGIYSAGNIALQDRFTLENLSIKRPFTGQAPYRIWDILNQNAKKEYKINEPIFD